MLQEMSIVVTEIESRQTTKRASERRACDVDNSLCDELRKGMRFARLASIYEQVSATRSEQATELCTAPSFYGLKF
jgi:hypothetical protein